jgi:calcineurin-like phosphoesterase family protein
MTRWVIGCTHFDDEGVAHYRGYSCAAEMGNKLERSWNSVVHPGDLVYILGDFALKRTAYWAARLAGTKILVIGNHDKEVCRSGIFFDVVDRVLLNVPPEHPKAPSQTVFMEHYPCSSWPGKFRDAVHLHAHSHGKQEVPCGDRFRRIDVSVDCWKTWPVLLDSVIHASK